MTRLLLTALLLCQVGVNAQTLISGKVTDSKGKPIFGASIAIKDSYDGTTSDSLGNYSFRTTEKGSRLMMVSSIGFKISEKPIVISGTALIQNIQLREEPNELTAVTISAGTFEASDTKRATVLSPIDIVTTASANADITGALNTLPGTQQVGESTGLFVRGGTAEETKVFIDGTLVNNFFLSSAPDIASRGRFSPFLFKGTVFSSGGYSALYGQALSSALILESVDLPDQSSASIGLSTVGINGGYQQLAKNKKSSWGGSYSYTNLAAYFALVKQRPDNFRNPELHNADFNFRIKTSKTGILKFYGYVNTTRFGLRRPDIDSFLLKDAFALDNFNLYGNLSWKEKLGKKWKITLGTGFNYNRDDISNLLVDITNEEVNITDKPFDTKSFDLKAREIMTTGKAVLERKLPGLSTFRLGGEYIFTRDKNVFTAGQSGFPSVKSVDNYSATFAEADVYLTTNLAARVGGRMEHSSLLGRSNIVPRVSLAYKVGVRGQASLAYGTFFEKPDKQFFLRNFDHTNNFLFTKATHYIANYQKVSRDYTLRAEIFYKKYDDLMKTYATGNGPLPDSAGNAGAGYAKGFELFWRDRKTFKDFDYWVSYSWLDTKRDYLNYPYAIHPNFAAAHTANLVIKKFVTRLKTQFNMSYTFATGRPYYNIRRDDGTGKFRIAGQGKTIPYNSMSLSVNYLPGITKTDAKKFTVFVFSVNNVLGNDQIFGYNYSYDGTNRQPVLPISRRFFFLGCFISFGVDRTEDVINSNL